MQPVAHPRVQPRVQLGMPLDLLRALQRVVQQPTYASSSAASFFLPFRSPRPMRTFGTPAQGWATEEVEHLVGFNRADCIVFPLWLCMFSGVLLQRTLERLRSLRIAQKTIGNSPVVSFVCF